MFYFFLIFGIRETSMATFSRLFKPPLPPFLPTLPCPTQRLKGNSGVTLRCSGCEQSSPFMHADMGRREEVDEGGWSGGMERREGSLLVGGQGSAFSARKERGNWGERFQMFRRQKAQSRTHTAHVSVSSCTVFKAGRTREANMCVNLGTALL